MKIFFLLLTMFAATVSQAATVRLYFVDPFTNERDTNAFYVTPIGTNVLSSGGVVSRGITTRYVPASDGYRTNTLAVGHYSITNRSLGSGVVIRVPESSALIDYTNILVSGYNIFVTVTNGSGGTSGALTNNETRSVTLADDLTVEGGTLTLGISSSENVIQASSGLVAFSQSLSSVGQFIIGGQIIGTNFVGNGDGLTNLTSAIAADTVVSNGVVAGLAAGSYAIDGGALAFSELYSAWVSKYGDNSTGTVGKRERPFAGVSNAVYAVKTALGSVNTNGVVYIGTGLWDEHLVNLQRTNLPGISLIGQGGTATMLTSRSTSSLTNLGALVLVGHSTKVIGVSISNDMSANFKQAGIGYDTSRDATLVGTVVVPTNVLINVPIGRGSSDVGYFYDSAGPSQYDITIDGCDWLSKWDAVFLSTLESGGQFKIKRSNIRVVQPDGYSFPGGGSGEGRARAVYIGNGELSVENSSVVAVGGNLSTNEVTGLTFVGDSGIGYTNINTFIEAQGSSGTINNQITTDIPQYLGKLNFDQLDGTLRLKTNFVSGEMFPVAGFIRMVPSNNVIYAVSTTQTNMIAGMKIYRALLTQSGASAPTATILENSLGTITYARSSPGLYTINCSGLFNVSKTIVHINASLISEAHYVTHEFVTASQIILRTSEDTAVPALADDILSVRSSIEILVYP